MRDVKQKKISHESWKQINTQDGNMRLLHFHLTILSSDLLCWVFSILFALFVSSYKIFQCYSSRTKKKRNAEQKQKRTSFSSHLYGMRNDFRWLSHDPKERSSSCCLFSLWKTNRRDQKKDCAHVWWNSGTQRNVFLISFGAPFGPS